MGLYELPRTGPADHFAVNEHGVSPHDRPHDPARERSTKVDAHPTPGLELLRREGPPLPGIHERKVRIGSDGDRAFARVQAEELCGRGGGHVRSEEHTSE